MTTQRFFFKQVTSCQYCPFQTFGKRLRSSGLANTNNESYGLKVKDTHRALSPRHIQSHGRAPGPCQQQIHCFEQNLHVCHNAWQSETLKPGWEDLVGKSQSFGDSIAIALSIERLCRATHVGRPVIAQRILFNFHSFCCLTGRAAQ